MQDSFIKQALVSKNLAKLSHVFIVAFIGDVALAFVLFLPTPVFIGAF